MEKIIYSLPNQIDEALASFPAVRPKKKKITSVCICGMGGSGISGDILATLYPRIRISTHKDYTIPDYVDDKTLAILISYSGNTEETLHSYRALAGRHATLVLLSSNGTLLKKKGDVKITVPGGLPPRGALGYLVTPLPLVLHAYHIIDRNPQNDLMALSDFLRHERDTIQQEAEHLSEKFIDMLPIIYANSQSFAPVANRWRCQLNENSKVLAHINIIPEMNHNEIVGLGRPEALNEKLLLIFLDDPHAYPRSRIRIQLVKEIVKGKIDNVIEVLPKGKSTLQRMFWTIMLGDFISYYLAVKTGIDPLPVERIAYLKKRLSEYS
jgi:glucose/mannose-6-phosphate isomerase